MTPRTPSFLMANLGSEITRLYLAQQQSDPIILAQCRNRAFLITKLLKHHPDLNGRTGEVMLIEFLIEDIVSNASLFNVKRSHLEAYFTPFAMRTLQSS